MPQKARHPNPAQGPRERRRRVLLVDADRDARALLAQALADEGLTVDEAVDVHDALAIVDYAPPDVVVYALGWGAGLHALDRLRDSIVEHGDRAPAVVLTTPVWVRARRGVTLRGPVRMHELIAAVERAVRQR